MEKLKELAFFEDLLKTSKNALIDKAIQEGRVPIGYNCYNVPEPMLAVGKLFPVCLRAPEVSSTEAANFYMSSFNCSYSRSILQSGIDGNLDFLGGIIFAASCMHIQRTEHNFEIAKLNDENEKYVYHVLDTPRKISPANVELMVRDMKRAAEKLSQSYDVDMSEAALTKAIKEHNEFNRLLKEIADLRKGDNPKITGTEWHTVYVATKVAPKEMLVDHLKKLKKELDKREGISADLPRIMVMGSIMDNPAFTALIEEQGCLVVADRYCFGSIPGLELIPEEGDPYVNLATHYLATQECPRMLELAQQRIDHALQLAAEYRVDGVIYEAMKFCDLWGWEAIKVLKAMQVKEIPAVRIEREYQLTGEGQMRTRVQAFIESIQNKKLNQSLAE